MGAKLYCSRFDLKLCLELLTKTFYSSKYFKKKVMQVQNVRNSNVKKQINQSPFDCSLKSFEVSNSKMAFKQT